MGSINAAQTVGIVGYGRFGRALAELFVDAGIAVRAWDPVAPVEPALAAGDGLAGVAACDVVVLAVPVAATAAAARAVHPFLGASQLVLDVASVKTGPVAALAEIFGRDVPWAGTHPLFGPTSLALGERPLRVVVCPNPMHPDAAPAARALFERAGCEVHEATPEEHDRAMADSHALTYFVAKGLLDAGAGFEGELLPPSALGIVRTLASVRSDAGHLYTALHLQNPYAAEARRRLLDALVAADAALRAPGAAAGEAPAAATAPASPEEIPDLGTRSPELRAARDLIDDVDRDILALLARRARLARRAHRAKAELGRGITDPRREEALRADRRAWADALNLDPDAVDEVVQALLRFSRRVQGLEEAKGRP